VAAQAGHLGEVETELVLEPVHGVAGAASKNADQVIARELARLKKVVSAWRLERKKGGRTDFLVSSKKIFALSGMPCSSCVCVPAPLMPDVALVELPPMKLRKQSA
jgi:hypothetical protein